MTALVSTTTSRLVREHDATPMVRLVTHLVELNRLWGPDSSELPDGAVVAIASQDDAQTATMRRSGDELHVGRGTSDCADLRVTVRFEGVQEIVHAESTSPGLLETATAMLNPALPPWPDLVAAFEAAAAHVTGMPALKIVETGGQHQLIPGPASERIYEVHGGASDLQRFLGGTRFFPDAVYAGELLIRGTFSQFSVVSGASMKVMWDV